jgi:hypothetical protein
LADYLEKSSKYKKTKLIIFLGNVMKSMDLFLILADYLEKSSKYKKTKLIIFLGNVMKSMDLFGIVKPVGDPLDIDVGLLIDDLSC